MRTKRTVLFASLPLLLVLAFGVPAANAKTSEYDLIVNHLKSKYRAKKVHIPFMWLARAAVHAVKPAGVKSFNVTLFQDLKFSDDTVDTEMQSAMRNAFSAEWSSVFHVHSRVGQQAYMYMREDGKDVKLTVVTIDKNEAAVFRATISPEKLEEFISDPKIFGISLNDDDKKPDVEKKESN
jgi:hypothetical protein